MTQFRTQPASRGVTIGRIGGVPVVLGFSWLILAAVLVVGLGPRFSREIGAGPGYALALGHALVIFVSVLAHEGAHAVVGTRAGHRTEKIVLTFLGGHTNLAGPVSGGPRNRDLLAIALAGPAANMLLALASFVLLAAAPASMTDGEAGYVLHELTFALLWANILLGGFNLLPGFPLDGGQIVESAVWTATGKRRRGTAAASWAGVVIGCGILAFSVVLLLMRQPMLLSGGTAATGIFIAYAAYQQLSRIPLLSFVDSWDVFSRMKPVVGAIDHSSPTPANLADAEGLIAVTHGGHVIGYVDPAGPQRAAARPGAPISDSMLFVSGTISRRLSTPAVIQELSRPGAWAVAVMDGERCVGVLTTEDLSIDNRDLFSQDKSPMNKKDA